ncbi:crotonase/enoyl-CoA hydratase family protein [Longivirga aurantiaca]|uniref:Crotonase/enoyl-CoA hydratase family protein n=1 Tax=Longivirga aurantiaca TaxID=1837743 RepID=A0ABW1T3I1_9ACTN
MTDEVLTEQQDRTLLITLNRPEAMNAINEALVAGLLAAVRRLDDDPGLTVGVLTGAGTRAFSAGMDLKAFSRGENMRGIYEFIRNGSRKPLLGAIEGLALAGGLEMALTCDLLVAAKGARLGIPEAKVGLFASAGGVMRLPSRVGYSTAMEMALTGDPILAEEAYERGLVARVCEPGDAVAAALELAQRVARNAPLSVATSKQLIRATQGTTEAEFWQLQEPYEAAIVASADAQEGPRAFAEKRPPQWTGA